MGALLWCGSVQLTVRLRELTSMKSTFIGGSGQSNQTQLAKYTSIANNSNSKDNI